MSVVIRMKRSGAKKRPFYRIVVADSRRQRDGRFVEILGYYDPIVKPFAVKMDEEKVKGWLGRGAQPSEQVASLLRRAGIAMSRASKPAKKAEAAAKKAPAKRAKKREVSARRLKNRAARVKKKASPKKPQPKKR